MSRVFAAGVGDQNMVIEDVAIETETTGRKEPKSSEDLVFSLRPKASQAGRCSRCRKRCPGYDAGAGMGRGRSRRWRTCCGAIAFSRHGSLIASSPLKKREPKESSRSMSRTAAFRRRL